MIWARQLLVAALASLILTLSVSSLFAQRQISGQGTEGFRALLASYRLKPLKDLNELNESPERTLLIAFRGVEAIPRYPLDRVPYQFVPDFVARGGAVLYASDQSVRRGWLLDFGVAIAGYKLYCPEESKQCYQGRSFCPFVEPAYGADIQLYRPRSFKPNDPREPTLDRVATNRPSYLIQLNNSALRELGRYQTPIRREDDRSFHHTRFDFARGRRFDKGGQILILADHSVFINEMLLPEDGDNDNLAFAANCIDWLILQPDLSKRDRVLLIDQTGTIETDFNLALTELPPPPVNPSQIPEFLWANRDLLWEHRDKLADLEDSGFFREFEQSNFFNELLLSWQPHWVWIRFTLAIVTLAILAMAVRRFFSARFRHAKNASRLAVALDRFRPRVGLLEQRLRSAMSRGQAFEAAREKARQFFTDLEIAPAEHGQTLPEFTIEAGWWQRRSLSHDLREAWRIAYADEPAPVSVKQWPKFQSRLQNLREAIRKGIIRFA